MIKQDKRFVLYGLVVISVAIFSIVNKSYDHYEQMIKSINPESNYKLMLEENSKIIEQGQLGDFFTCMTRFKAGHQWRSNGTGKLEKKYLLINDRYLLQGFTESEEVLKLSIRPLNGKGNIGSAVAVNCSLSLLNKTKQD